MTPDSFVARVDSLCNITEDGTVDEDGTHFNVHPYIYRALMKLAAVAKFAPRGCICHVAHYDGYMGSTDHTERCRTFTDALKALETP